ncbi:MAG: LysM domain-containing protein [Lachnospiraceae bacterium]|nr:LysM domain-containing protein [Lachnospiraceae bacterium]
MIETIYRETNSEGIKPDVNIRLPKNIKQIGQGDANMNYQIYIEENVLFYIKQEPTSNDGLRYGVLLGEKKQGNGYTYVFINGVIEVDNIIENTILFSDDIWTGIYDNLKRYYKKSDIVGWFASAELDLTKDIHAIKKLHLDHFAGNGKVYLNIIREESDEAFYVYERNGLRKQSCYHVYFEKASEFEDYLFGTGYTSYGIEEKKEVKEVGKYGIAINNSKPEKVLPKTIKFGKAASFAAILALSGIVYYMGSNGKMDALSDKFNGLMNGIVQKEGNQGDIVSVNGNVEQITTTVAEAAAKESAKTSTEAAKDGQSQETTINNEEKTEQKTTISQDTTNNQKTTADQETTTQTEATISEPNQNYQVYIVESGDTLYSIALSKCGSADKIKDIIALNKLENENYVIEGQKILLP